MAPATAWPALQRHGHAALLSMLHQVEQAQWSSPERARELQALQLGRLLRHAHANVPYYRSRWAGLYDEREGAFTWERFQGLPILTRRDLQENFDNLKSARIPRAHGKFGEGRSSGSTGTPVRFLHTSMTQLAWRVCTLRDHLWHRRDLRAKLAVIRALPKTPARAGHWGNATRGLVATGPAASIPITTPVAAQLDWLAAERPGYLMTYPSNVTELARESLRRRLRLDSLLQVRTLGEMLDPETRSLVREAWGVPVIDAYSSEEVGYIALQCPDNEHYHVPSEFTLVEVLDAGGRPVAPGSTGRVVVTALHNTAMPLVRYELGDYAQTGGPCSCGRNLPVLARIAGRTRNMLVAPDGSRVWPFFSARRIRDLAPVVQHQFVQTAPDLLEARLVVSGALTPAQEQAVRTQVLSALPQGLRLHFVYVDVIARGANGKFEDFICRLA